MKDRIECATCKHGKIYGSCQLTKIEIDYCLQYTIDPRPDAKYDYEYNLWTTTLKEIKIM